MNFPFKEPENTAVMTCRHIIENSADILYVSHDKDDGFWQFLCGATHIQSDARVVALGEIFTLDNSLSQLADMPCGYFAERKNKSANWVINRINKTWEKS